MKRKPPLRASSWPPKKSCEGGTKLEECALYNMQATGRCRMIARWLPLSVLMGSVAVAQQPAPADRLPEVEINARRQKLADMRARIVEAEDRFYEEYNKLNLSDDFDMVCHMETPIDSHLKSRVCRPVFV